MPPPLPPAPPTSRSIFVTALAWTAMIVGGLLSVISFIALLMVLSGSPGSGGGGFFEGFLVLGLPPLTVVGGIGLLGRKRWGFAFTTLVLSGFACGQLAEIARGPTPDQTFTSPSGTVTTVTGSSPNVTLALVIFGACVACLAKLFSKSVRAEFAINRLSELLARRAPAATGDRTAPAPATPLGFGAGPSGLPAPEADAGWRVGHEGRDALYYEERAPGGGWRRIEIGGEMLMGRARHVIYFATPSEWLKYPEWARPRRDEIIARVISRFAAPDYAHDFGGVAPAPLDHARTRGTAGQPGTSFSALWRSPTGRAGLIALAVLLAIAGATGWIVVDALKTGDVRLPIKSGAARRLVVRAQKPAMFLTSIVLYATVGAGALGVGAWGVRVARRGR